jgi:hypothetical protein
MQPHLHAAWVSDEGAAREARHGDNTSIRELTGELQKMTRG